MKKKISAVTFCAVVIFAVNAFLGCQSEETVSGPVILDDDTYPGVEGSTTRMTNPEFKQKILKEDKEVKELGIIPSEGGYDDGSPYYAKSAYGGGTGWNDYPPYYYSPKKLASYPYLGGWLDHMYVIKYEDARYWATYAGWYGYQGYLWEDVPEGAILNVVGRYATQHYFDIYAWDGSSDWDYIGTTGWATSFEFDVSNYIHNGHVNILCYYGYRAWGTTNCSYIRLEDS